MDIAATIIGALEGPAALTAADGRVLAANAAFRAAPASTVWRSTCLDDGRVLMTPAQDAGGPPGDRYLAQLSHELRTPLNGVLGMAELLGGTRLAADQRAYLSALQECGRHLLGLVNNVLDLARLEAHELALHPAPLAPKALLQSVAELLSPRATAKGLEIAWTAPIDAPVVLADEARIRQILFNLAGNAIKFTEEGGVLLSVEHRCSAAGVTLRFIVADTGPGVPESERERIFQPFAQAHDGSRVDSTGLGLAIARRLADAQGGRILLECPPKGGSRFMFEAAFPIVSAPDDAPGPLAGRTVAVVSPSGIVRDGAAGLIEAAGGRAVVGASPVSVGALGADAVVLLDHALAASKRGRLRPPAGLPCVVLLAPEERAQIARYRKAGFCGYLIKPLRDVSLVERVLAAAGAATARADASDERASGEVALGARVLLAEDNPINALLARSLLEREGCAVDLAVNGEDAVTAAVAGAHDLILMDLRMPGMDGLSAARAMRASGLTAPIIALTADAFEEDRRACLAAGMDDFVSKPLVPAALKAVLRRWAHGGWTLGETQAKLAG